MEESHGEENAGVLRESVITITPFQNAKREAMKY